MIIAVAGFKGGVGKTTTAMHLAAYFHQNGSTLLIDADPNQSAIHWAKRGKGLPFSIFNEEQAAGHLGAYHHVVIDTQARLLTDELQDLAQGCDLFVLPCSPDALSLDALLLTLSALKTCKATQTKILLTIIPPWPSQDGITARRFLKKETDVEIFQGSIRRMIAYQKAALSGELVYTVSDPRAKMAWSDYLAVGKEILP